MSLPPALLLPSVSTLHARLLPAESRTRFEYPLFYVAIDVRRLERTIEGVSSWLWGIDWESSVPPLFGLRTKDYLKVQGAEGNGLDTIEKRMLYWLEQVGIDPTRAGSSYLLTTPCVLGYAFRPLSVHYVLKARDESKPEDEQHHRELLCVILEVANTFGDSHIYMLDERNRVKTRTGYDTSNVVHRSFHVSPFNHRKGWYVVHLTNPFNGGIGESRNLDVSITFHDSPSDPKEDVAPGEYPKTPKVFFARLFSILEAPTFAPVTQQNLLTLFATMPLTAFLTFPRILYQAALVHYGYTSSRGKLPVYSRPEPVPSWTDINGKPVTGGELIESKMNGSWVKVYENRADGTGYLLQWREGYTIFKDVSDGGWFGRRVLPRFLSQLSDIAHSKSKNVVVTFTDPSLQTFSVAVTPTSPSDCLSPANTIRIHLPHLLLPYYLALVGNDSQSTYAVWRAGYAAGWWEGNPRDIVNFLRVEDGEGGQTVKGVEGPIRRHNSGRLAETIDSTDAALEPLAATGSLYDVVLLLWASVEYNLFGSLGRKLAWYVEGSEPGIEEVSGRLVTYSDGSKGPNENEFERWSRWESDVGSARGR
ncbi:hypothetical protein M427DRAFT_56449 [Gonapodya prolifera JEL478]|uniref:DUF1365-domain-containing protein n=1 Tax=Gonapodya prolifera (strain JEL478) TaxID=1344416 RepID=A0A139AGE6_GONPJ|nr:hypothetical protein M427DRAFT_56449 [Gonapodya prolifera JEL478]|eukprot:KXS15881.1 hypothetical protein M427DRAFT_56449 [Gonapodya prolifera JEL478]